MQCNDRCELHRIAIAFPRTILTIAEVVCGRKHFDHFTGSLPAIPIGLETRQFIARNLFAYKAIEWFVRIDRLHGHSLCTCTRVVDRNRH